MMKDECRMTNGEWGRAEPQSCRATEPQSHRATELQNLRGQEVEPGRDPARGGTEVRAAVVSGQ